MNHVFSYMYDLAMYPESGRASGGVGDQPTALSRTWGESNVKQRLPCASWTTGHNLILYVSKS